MRRAWPIMSIKSVSLGFTSLNPSVIIMDRNPFISLLSTPQTHLIPVGRETSCSNRSPSQPKEPRKPEKPSVLCWGLFDSFPPSSWRGRGLIRVPLQLHTCETFTGTETAVVPIKQHRAGHLNHWHDFIFLEERVEEESKLIRERRRWNVLNPCFLSLKHWGMSHLCKD